MKETVLWKQIKKKKLTAVSPMWKLMQMAQMDFIRFARWRELGLLRIIIYLNMLTYVSNTEISP